VSDDYKSPKHKLLQSCRESRSKWKKKAQDNLARLKNAENKKAYHHDKSTEQRQKIKSLEQEILELRSELDLLKKKG